MQIYWVDFWCTKKGQIVDSKLKNEAISIDWVINFICERFKKISDDIARKLESLEERNLNHSLGCIFVFSNLKDKLH